ncbi:MAG: hypothetical protein IT329_15935 [Caldilineaceae bacterium]|nr:hypothetical protein [Caldilineaceae bacterium]
MEQAKHTLSLRPISSFQKRKGVSTKMTTTSILVKREIDRILQIARRCFDERCAMQTTLFVHVSGNERIAMPLVLPETYDKKALMFFALGHQLHERGLTPNEAVLLSESWFVGVQSAPAALKIPPSQHPSRQEAIVAIGRSADGSRYSQVVQPFTRDTENRPVWQPIPIAMYDEKRTGQDGPTGILDYLFEAIPVSS